MMCSIRVNYSFVHSVHILNLTNIVLDISSTKLTNYYCNNTPNRQPLANIKNNECLYYICFNRLDLDG